MVGQGDLVHGDVALGQLLQGREDAAMGGTVEIALLQNRQSLDDDVLVKDHGGQHGPLGIVVMWRRPVLEAGVCACVRHRLWGSSSIDPRYCVFAHNILPFVR